MEQIFTHVYENKIWGDNQNSDYSGSSGGGSDTNYNKDTYIPIFKKIILDKKITSVVDLGCGDFRCGKLLYEDMDVTYTGYDTYQKVVEYNAKQFPSPKYSFHHLDFYTYKEKLEHADLCILKDVLQHWSLEYIYTFLDYIVQHKMFKYVLICNCGYQKKHNTDIPTGEFRPLSGQYFPLKKYNPIVIGIYHTKEISILDLKRTMEDEIRDLKKEVYELKCMVKKCMTS